MKVTLFKFSLIALFSVGLTSCGGEGGQALTQANAANVLGQFNTVMGFLPKTNTVPALPVAGATTSGFGQGRVGTRSVTDCETSTPTTPTDADSDGIALTKTSTFDCTNQTFGTNVYTRKGTMTVTDLDDTVAGMIGGIRVDFGLTDYKSVDSTDGSISDGSYDGYWLYQRSGNKLVSTSSFNGRSFYDSATTEFVNDYTYGYTWNWTLTPDDVSAPWTSGAVEWEGTFKMDGRFVHEDASGNHTQASGTYSMRHYTRGLRYDSVQCPARWYSTGSIFIDDGNGNLFEIRYNCTTATLYRNGVESDWWTP